MALHKDLPDDPHAILDPALRWFPADEALRTTSFEKLLPPLVPKLRKEVKTWRDAGYDRATPTSQSLLRWACSSGLPSPLHHPLNRRLAVDDVSVGLQRNPRSPFSFRGSPLGTHFPEGPPSAATIDPR